MDAQTVNIQEIERRLPRLLEQVASDLEVIITKKGEPVARVTPIGEKTSKIRFGVLKGKASISDDFDAPLPDDPPASFEGDECAY